MQLEYLSTLKLDSEIRDRLGKLPPKLEQLYSDIYQGMLLDVTGIRVEVIQHVFKWLLCARHQLNTADMISLVRRKSSRQFQDLTEDHAISSYEAQKEELARDMPHLAHLASRKNFNLVEMRGVFFQDWAFSRFRGGNHTNLMPAQTYACRYWPYHCEKAQIERTRLPLSRSLQHFMLEPGFVAE
jgi:hypothetical protein